MESKLAQTDTEGLECVICLERLLVAAGSTSDTLDDISKGSVVGFDDTNSTEDVAIPFSSSTVTTTDDKHNIIAEVSSISGCNHIYHDKCIKEWSSVTNSKYLHNS